MYLVDIVRSTRLTITSSKCSISVATAGYCYLVRVLLKMDANRIKPMIQDFFCHAFSAFNPINSNILKVVLQIDLEEGSLLFERSC